MLGARGQGFVLSATGIRLRRSPVDREVPKGRKSP
jgi:hypothetical protein